VGRTGVRGWSCRLTRRNSRNREQNLTQRRKEKQIDSVGRKSRRARRAAILVDRFRAGFEPHAWRSYQPAALARQRRSSEVSAARPCHTPTAQIRRDTVNHVSLVTTAPRSSPYQAHLLLFAALREILPPLLAAVGCGIGREELFDLAPGWNAALAAGLSGFQAGGGGGKTDTLVEGSSLD